MLRRNRRVVGVSSMAKAANAAMDLADDSGQGSDLVPMHHPSTSGPTQAASTICRRWQRRREVAPVVRSCSSVTVCPTSSGAAPPVEVNRCCLACEHANSTEASALRREACHPPARGRLVDRPQIGGADLPRPSDWRAHRSRPQGAHRRAPPQFAEARAAEQARIGPAWGLGMSAEASATALRGVQESFAELRQEKPPAPPSELLEGVTADQWL